MYSHWKLSFIAIAFGTFLSWTAGFWFFWQNMNSPVDSAVLTRMKTDLKKIRPDYLLTESGGRHLESEEEFGPLRIGGNAPDGEGMEAALGRKIIPKSNFYIYVQRRGLSLCEFDNCGIAEGKVVQCMGGWLSGDGHHEISDLVGLDSLAVSEGKASIVVLSDENSKIVGIFPYHTEGDIIPILARYPEYEKSLHDCTDEEIGLPEYELVPFKRPDIVPNHSGAELQVLMKEARKIAIVMPDGSFQDSKGQIIYEPYFEPDKNRYLIYRPGYGYFIEKTKQSDAHLSFRNKEDAIEWMKNTMMKRGYKVIDF